MTPSFMIPSRDIFICESYYVSRPMWFFKIEVIAPATSKDYPKSWEKSLLSGVHCATGYDAKGQLGPPLPTPREEAQYSPS